MNYLDLIDAVFTGLTFEIITPQPDKSIVVINHALPSGTDRSRNGVRNRKGAIVDDETFPIPDQFRYMGNLVQIILSTQLTIGIYFDPCSRPFTRHHDAVTLGFNLHSEFKQSTANLSHSHAYWYADDQRPHGATREIRSSIEVTPIAPRPFTSFMTLGLKFGP